MGGVVVAAAFSGTIDKDLPHPKYYRVNGDPAG